MAIKSYTSVAASNTSLFPEGMAPSMVNDSARQVQADIRSWYTDAEWTDFGDVPSRASNTTFKVAANVTAEYVAGRRLKCYDATTIYATVVSSSYSAPDTTITTVNDSGNLSASLTSVALSILKPASRALPGTCSFRATRDTTQSITQNVDTKVQFATETFDTMSTYDNSTNYRHTPTVPGIYFYRMQVVFEAFTNANVAAIAKIFKNGSEVVNAFNRGNTAGAIGETAMVSILVSMNGTTDYVEAYCQQQDAGAVNIAGGGSLQNVFEGFRISQA